MKTIIFLLAFLITPFCLLAQTYQQDTATIYRLLKSAKNKRFSDSATATREAQQALALAQKHDDGYWIYESYHRLGRIQEVNNQDKKAFTFFVKQLEVEHKLDDSTKSAMYSEVARSYKNVGNFQKAYELMLKNQELSIRLNNMDMQLTSNSQLGLFYMDMSDFEKATQYLMKSIELSTQLNYSDDVCENYRMLAHTYLRTKNYDLALKAAEKSISYINQVDNYMLPHYFVYNTYGKVLKECKKYKESIKAFEKAAELSNAVDDKSNLANIYNVMAETYTELNDFKQADIYYKKCSEVLSETSDLDVMICANSYGNFLLKKGEYDKAIVLLNKSVALTIQYNKKGLLQKNYELLSKSFEQKNDHKQSLFYIKKAMLLRDTVFSDENMKRVAEAQFKYDLAQSEEDVKKIKNRQFYTISISISVVLLLLIAFLAYFLRSKNQKNRLLLEKTLVLTETTSIIKDKNRQLEESNEILKQFAFASAHDLKEPLRSINSFVNLIQRRYLKDAAPEAHEYMGFVTTGVKRMESLLNALLEYSSVLTDENLEKKENDLAKLLASTLLNQQNLITEKKAIVRGPSVFPTIFMGEGHLKLLLDNLVSNALKFSNADAQIEVNYSITDTECIVSVKDEGIGMDKSYGDKIFKLFQRLDRVTHKESVGIGLTICKNIVDKYAGRIWFDSVVNEGTTFFIAFPKSMISDVPTTEGAPQYFGHFEQVVADLSAV
jgi:signal transduction histidine kinase